MIHPGFSNILYIQIKYIHIYVYIYNICIYIDTHTWKVIAYWSKGAILEYISAL